MMNLTVGMMDSSLKGMNDAILIGCWYEWKMNVTMIWLMTEYHIDRDHVTMFELKCGRENTSWASWFMYQNVITSVLEN